MSDSGNAIKMSRINEKHASAGVCSTNMSEPLMELPMLTVIHCTLCIRHYSLQEAQI